jgi:hypothetical protein
VREAGAGADAAADACGGVAAWREDGAEARRELGVDAGVGGFEDAPAAEFSIGDGVGGVGVRWWSIGGAGRGSADNGGNWGSGRLRCECDGVGDVCNYSLPSRPRAFLSLLLHLSLSSELGIGQLFLLVAFFTPSTLAFLVYSRNNPIFALLCCFCFVFALWCIAPLPFFCCFVGGEFIGFL